MLLLSMPKVLMFLNPLRRRWLNYLYPIISQSKMHNSSVVLVINVNANLPLWQTSELMMNFLMIQNIIFLPHLFRKGNKFPPLHEKNMKQIKLIFYLLSFALFSSCNLYFLFFPNSSLSLEIKILNKSYSLDFHL